MPTGYKPSKGSTLLIPSGTIGNPDAKHLFFVLTNSCAGNCHLLVSASSVKPNRVFDQTCPLAAGDHPFIAQESYIFYASIRQTPQAGIMKCVDSGLYVPKDDCDPTVLDRIRAGITASPMTPRWAKEYFRVNGSR
jgi:hypothetical protein